MYMAIAVCKPVDLMLAGETETQMSAVNACDATSDELTVCFHLVVGLLTH